jgi:hypothetical protein
MDFYAILDQVIALLQQRGKASYRALQLHFKLDDASLGACPGNKLSGLSGHRCCTGEVRR